MRYPKFLPDNGTIGFVAPSFGCNIEPYRSAFANARRKWGQMGYKLKLGPNCFEDKGIGISNTPEACGKELTEYYVSGENDCLISCGGGELMCEVLDEVDFDALKKAPAKWYMGYSDNTNMTYLLATICDTASVYGPCAAAFGMEPWHESLQDAMDMLTGRKLSVKGYSMWEKESLKSEENPTAAYHVTEVRVLRCFPGNGVAGERAGLAEGGLAEKGNGLTEGNGDPAGKFGKEEGAVKVLTGEMIPRITFNGRLLGGCMDCLVNLLGTKYDKTADFIEKYKDDGIIWLLEACDLTVFGIRRAMWQMEHAGWFKHVKGFLIGRPLCFGQEMMGLDAYQAVLDIAARKNVPVVMDVDLGHLPPMMPLVVGSLGEVTVCGNEVEVKMELKP